MKRNRFERFKYITGLNDSQKATFLLVIETMILNLDIRFPCPGFSIELGVAKRNTNVISKTLEHAFNKKMSMRCPFLMEVDLFNFPDNFIKGRRINEWFLRTFQKMESFLKEMVERKNHP